MSKWTWRRTQWNNTRNQICSQNNYFTFNSQKSKFLIGLHSNHPEYYPGACSYIIGQFRSSNKNDFIGSLLAYEFDSKGPVDVYEGDFMDLDDAEEFVNKLDMEDKVEDEIGVNESIEKTLDLLKRFQKYN